MNIYADGLRRDAYQLLLKKLREQIGLKLLGFTHIPYTTIFSIDLAGLGAPFCINVKEAIIAYFRESNIIVTFDSHPMAPDSYEMKVKIEPVEYTPYGYALWIK